MAKATTAIFRPQFRLRNAKNNCGCVRCVGFVASLGVRRDKGTSRSLSAQQGSSEIQSHKWTESIILGD